ncbi:hypothetical protein Leryth_015503 [Lithospermum erythrorhizon]|nr:hypothetical protein Leryth_015503 [Lithospermum erythrorhizon]
MIPIELISKFQFLMFTVIKNSRIYHLKYLPFITSSSSSSCIFSLIIPASITMDRQSSSSSFTTYAQRSGGRGRGLDTKDNRGGGRGRGGGGRGGGAGKDKIDALGRLLTRILRHMASELSLNIRPDGYVKVRDLLNVNMKTSANIPLRSHTIDDVREVCCSEHYLPLFLSDTLIIKYFYETRNGKGVFSFVLLVYVGLTLIYISLTLLTKMFIAQALFHN